MTDQETTDESMDSAAPTDRRKPIARYVEYGDESVQTRFIALAESAYQLLAKADKLEGVGQVELRGTPGQASSRRGLFRRAPAGTVVPTTPALAIAAYTIGEAPGEVRSAETTCDAASRVAMRLATVANDLVRDQLSLEPTEQAAHPAYQQTLRLTSELQALRDLVAQVGCTDPFGCVGIRSPESWGRRIEDIEVTEVRAVLLHLAGTAASSYA